jgi:4-diphosphocytidyl-2-C-methyl-D-erythritol kinase
MAADPTAMTPAALVTRAPAKINLTLHIRARRADGYHDLQSLVAFAGSADTLTLQPGEGLSLDVTGPTAVAAGSDQDNLVLRAARNLMDRVPNLRTGAFHLVKRLPVAAGVGGGSSDAAAALRLLARLNGLDMADDRVMAAAQATGADVPVCVAARARMMAGIGEQLGPVLRLPPLFAVLVNPGVAVETREVFSRIGLAPGAAGDPAAHPVVPDGVDFATLLPLLRRGRNDMEDAASVVAPIIAQVLGVLAVTPGCRLARMSGSGATCFALFENCRAAARAARVLRRDHPGWWAKATVLR